MPRKDHACRQMKERFLDYVTARLPASEAEKVAQHLASCAVCRQEEAEYRAAVALTTHVQESPMPSSQTTWQALLPQLETTSVPRWLPARKPMLAWSAAGFAIAAFALFLFFAHRPQPHSVSIATNGRNRERIVTNPLVPSPQPRQQMPTPFQNVVTPEPKERRMVTNALLPRPHTDKPGIQTPQEPGMEIQEAPSLQVANSDDMAYLNADTSAALSRWTHLPPDKIEKLAAQWKQMAHGDDFVTVPFPQIAGGDKRAVQAAVEAYQREAAVVDTRLIHKVNLAVKGMAFSELCQLLSEETGVKLTASRRVADDKVTVFCNPRPLRDIMRQMSQHFGFLWLRDGDEGDYHYELTQSVRSQLLEEELRNRDRDDALTALDKGMERYRKFARLSYSALRELVAKTPPKEALELYPLAEAGWLPARLYFGLSAEELDALRKGKELKYVIGGDGGPFSLPLDLQKDVQETFADVRVDTGGKGPLLDTHPKDPQAGQPLSAMQNVQSYVTLRLDKTQLGKFTLKGDIEIRVTVDGRSEGIGRGIELAVGVSPTTDSPQNALVNAKLAQDADLRGRVTITPQPSCKMVAPNYPDLDLLYNGQGERVTTGDVLEAVFKATGKDLISDFYTRLYTPEQVTVQNAALFDALNRLSDTMRARWNKGEGWLQFRSARFFYDRPQEIPARLLAHWAASRRQNGMLTLDDLAEITQLSDAQLDAQTMAQGAVACYGLLEWPVARAEQTRAHFRFLADLPQSLRQAVQTQKGVTFEQLPPVYQKRFVELAFERQDEAFTHEPSELAGASLRVEYSRPNAQTGELEPPPLLVTNPVAFVYTYGDPAKIRRTSVIGSFNAIIGGTEAMNEQRRQRNKK